MGRNKENRRTSKDVALSRLTATVIGVKVQLANDNRAPRGDGRVSDRKLLKLKSLGFKRP